MFVYSDSDFLVICSTITSIVRFLVAQGISPVANKHALSRYFLTRHYLFLGDSPFSGISKIEGGKVFSVDIPQNSCRCIYDAALNLQPEYKHELDLLDVIENEAYSDSINHKSAFILSGGIDSSLTARVASQLPGYHSSKRLFVTLTFGERDLTALQARQQAQSIGISEFLEIPVTVESYLESLDTFYSDYYMPACTHSFISNNILCRELSNNGVRLLYGGEGADELFQGYEAYKKIFDMSDLPVGSSSPYSRIANSNLLGTPQYSSKLDDDEYINRYLDRYSNLGLHPDFSGFLLDATLQLQSTGNLCSDITGSHHAIESRSPFVHIRNLKRLHKSIDTFNKERTCKPILRQLFLSSYDHTFLKPKQGYSGFPNEAASQLLPSLKFPLCSDLLSVNLSNRLDDIDRSFEWKMYNMELFLERCL